MSQLSTPPAPYSTLPYIDEQESFSISPILLSGYCPNLPPTPRLTSQPLSPISPISETSSLPSDSYESFSAPSSPPTFSPSSLCGAMGNLGLDGEVAPASPHLESFSESESEDDAEYAPSTSKARRAAKKAVASASTSHARAARAAPKNSARAPTQKPARAAARDRAAPYTRKHTTTTITTPNGRVVPTHTPSRNEQIGLPSEYVELTKAETGTLVCPACRWNYGKKRAADLVRHFKTHYGIRDDVCGCGMEFSRTDALIRHVRRHRWALCAIL
ncbi:hypothetical protein PHLGIDRAFT_237876 [Phlebiopsis gigantea 11061_1 CR5-6]|uniref:C2H2-type domain-containing protein n=1 Tax=Phlebiopsis gigantea (strain 11061_1 CR5-6) TaxID=745531 RepID=A0A0C3S5E0_PHLG1|nr:hypothetical protein PHLGIDRAFT_237876 [Phlebiopsis gigantea 11061_1 CR5-6]